ncbi:MAG: hypothetical protein EOO39_00235 [Cytophagaceae bacterium]|nr:MAG: hypothetical protein EOO39_00235 [Cytophagaceae bacterium]
MLEQIQSHPTPPELARAEVVNEGFVKLHPGPPIHVFTKMVDKHFHTHPFDFQTAIVMGAYVEEVLVPMPDGSWKLIVCERVTGTTHRMPAGLPHRLVGLVDGEVCITRCEYFERTEGERWSICRFDEQGILLHRFAYEAEDKWRPYVL